MTNTTLNKTVLTDEERRKLPDYFNQLLIDAAVTQNQLVLFAQLVIALCKIRCTQTTVEILCVQECVKSIRQLKDKNWSFRNYRSLSDTMTICQASILFENVHSLQVALSESPKELSYIKVLRKRLRRANLCGNALDCAIAFAYELDALGCMQDTVLTICCTYGITEMTQLIARDYTCDDYQDMRISADQVVLLVDIVQQQKDLRRARIAVIEQSAKKQNGACVQHSMQLVHA